MSVPGPAPLLVTTPLPDSEGAVGALPSTSKTPLLPITTADKADRAVLLPVWRVPAVIVVGPLKVFTPLRTCTPLPLRVKAVWAVPSWIEPLKVAELPPVGADGERGGRGAKVGHDAPGHAAVGQRRDGLVEAGHVKGPAAVGNYQGGVARQAGRKAVISVPIV